MGRVRLGLKPWLRAAIGNELLFDDFVRILAAEGHEWDFRADGMAQISHIVEHSFRASWDVLNPNQAYGAFQVCGQQPSPVVRPAAIGMILLWPCTGLRI